MYCAGADFRDMLIDLPRLNPTVIISVPSIIERSFNSLKSPSAGQARPSASKIIFVGEPLSADTRGLLATTFGVEIFGYYGASETSALGIECRAHDGIHLFTDQNIAEVVTDRLDPNKGELVITTLRQHAYPLIRYALRDRVAIMPGACPCGLPHPRVDVLGRADDTISILGAKISYCAIFNAVYQGADQVGAMQSVRPRERGGGWSGGGWGRRQRGTTAGGRAGAGASAVSIAGRSMPGARPTPGVSAPPMAATRPSYRPPASTVPWAPKASVVNSNAVWQ